MLSFVVKCQQCYSFLPFFFHKHHNLSHHGKKKVLLYFTFFLNFKNDDAICIHFKVILGIVHCIRFFDWTLPGSYHLIISTITFIVFFYFQLFLMLQQYNELLRFMNNTHFLTLIYMYMYRHTPSHRYALVQEKIVRIQPNYSSFYSFTVYTHLFSTLTVLVIIMIRRIWPS